jgi:hypothetical protein
MTKDIAKKQPGRLDEIARLGQWLAAAESGDSSPNAKGATAALRLYYATELGLTPLAVAELSMIKGRLYVGAQLLRALAVQRGYRIFRVDLSDETCTARIVDHEGRVLGESTFTLEHAKKAGLIRAGSPWTTHPSRMLWARASKNAIIDFAPEVALGLALDDELQEIVPPPLPDDLVDDEIPFGNPEGIDAVEEYELESEYLNDNDENAVVEALQEMAEDEP